MLISLKWAKQPHFWVLWDSQDAPAENIKFWWLQLRGQWGAYRGGGKGCICGWAFPQVRRWPHWFWDNHYWDHHVLQCPEPRDADGNIIV